MEQYTRSVGPLVKLKMYYDKFTSVERIVADFFLHNHEKVDLSSRAIADRLYVSEASLSRFAQKCGYRGYREFIYQYETAFAENLESVTGNMRILMNAYNEVLKSVYRLTDEAQIVRIVQYIKEAQQVLVCGQGYMESAAAEMEERFLRAGVNITAVRDSGRMRLLPAFQDSHSLVFCVSADVGAEAELYLLRESCQRGAKTVLVSSEDNADFRQFCTEMLLIPSLHPSRNNVISPQFPPLLVLDILYFYYEHFCLN